jgi:four helix bundle protein
MKGSAMRSDVEQLIERVDTFASDVIDLVESLPATQVGRHLSGQLLRSGTSTAANYQEACAAESTADFIHKMQIVLKELRESRFWIRMVQRRPWKVLDATAPLHAESDELVRIFTKSVITAKARLRKLPESQ